MGVVIPVNGPLRSNSVRFLRLPKVEGIDPVNSLPLRSNFVRLVRSPREEGITPVTRLEGSDNTVTRPFSASTPYHWSNGTVLPQFVLFFQLTPPVSR